MTSKQPWNSSLLEEPHELLVPKHLANCRGYSWQEALVKLLLDPTPTPPNISDAPLPLCSVLGLPIDLNWWEQLGKQDVWFWSCGVRVQIDPYLV